MNTNFRKVFKQRNIGLWLGAFKHSASQISIYTGLLNLFLLLTTLYSTGWVQDNIIKLSYIQFMGIGAAIIILLLIYSYLVDMRSYFGFWSKQVGLDKMEKDIKAIKKHLGIEDEP